jgi:hypothetical protein
MFRTIFSVAGSGWLVKTGPGGPGWKIVCNRVWNILQFYLSDGLVRCSRLNLLDPKLQWLIPNRNDRLFVPGLEIV